MGPIKGPVLSCRPSNWHQILLSLPLGCTASYRFHLRVISGIPSRYRHGAQYLPHMCSTARVFYNTPCPISGSFFLIASSNWYQLLLSLSLAEMYTNFLGYHREWFPWDRVVTTASTIIRLNRKNAFRHDTSLTQIFLSCRNLISASVLIDTATRHFHLRHWFPGEQVVLYLVPPWSSKIIGMCLIGRSS